MCTSNTSIVHHFVTGQASLGLPKIQPPWQLSPATASRLREVPCPLDHKPWFPSLTPTARPPCPPGTRLPSLALPKPPRDAPRPHITTPARTPLPPSHSRSPPTSPL